MTKVLSSRVTEHRYDSSFITLDEYGQIVEIRFKPESPVDGAEAIDRLIELLTVVYASN